MHLQGHPNLLLASTNSDYVFTAHKALFNWIFKNESSLDNIVMIGLPLVLHMLLCGSTAVGNSTLHLDQQDILPEQLTFHP